MLASVSLAALLTSLGAIPSDQFVDCTDVLLDAVVLYFPTPVPAILYPP